MIQLEFKDDFPEEKEKLLRRLLTPLLRIVERDLSKITLKVSTEIPGEASIQVLKRYHCANIYLGLPFFEMKEKEQSEILVHELMHVLVNMLSKSTSLMLDAYFEDSAERAFIESTLEENEEKLTDALALAFSDILRELEENKTLVNNWMDSGDF